jgi:hypothetical protein
MRELDDMATVAPFAIDLRVWSVHRRDICVLDNRQQWQRSLSPINIPFGASSSSMMNKRSGADSKNKFSNLGIGPLSTAHCKTPPIAKQSVTTLLTIERQVHIHSHIMT